MDQKKRSPQEESGRYKSKHSYYSTFRTLSHPRLLDLRCGLYAASLKETAGNVAYFLPSGTAAGDRRDVLFEIDGAAAMTEPEHYRALRQLYTPNDHLFLEYFLAALYEQNGARSKKKKKAELKLELRLSLKAFAEFCGRQRAEARRIAKHGLAMLKAFRLITAAPAGFKRGRSTEGAFAVTLNEAPAKHYVAKGWRLDMPRGLFCDPNVSPLARAVYCYLAELQHRDLTGWRLGRAKPLTVKDLIAHTPLARINNRHTTSRLREPLEAALNCLKDRGLIVWSYADFKLPFKQRSIIYNANAAFLHRAESGTFSSGKRAKSGTKPCDIGQKVALLGAESGTCPGKEWLRNAAFKALARGQYMINKINIGGGALLAPAPRLEEKYSSAQSPINEPCVMTEGAAC